MATDEPMMASVAGRYAFALFELANEQRKLKEVEDDLKSLQALIEASADLKRLVRSPVFSAEEQSRAVAAVAAKAGFDGLTSNFLKLIARNRRLFVLGDMIKAFRALAARHRGEVSARVISAHALNDAQLEALKDTLRSSVGGKAVQVEAKVDPNLLGGLIVRMGSRMIDSSIRTKLNNLKIAMKGTG